MDNIIGQAEGRDWAAYQGDCVAWSRGLPDNCLDLQVYSPPFSSLYVYSESVADMGNVESDEEFIEQYRFLVREKFRTLRPGRVSVTHVKDLVYYQNSSEDGAAGLRPFSDMVTRLHIEEGFHFHCRITIYRDPVLERSKTNAHGLLWKSFQKDASFCRVGMPEYLLVFRKWAKDGEESLVRPVRHPKSDVPLKVWQDLASPVWSTKERQIVVPYGDPRTLGGALIWNHQEPGRGDGDLPATDVLNVKAARDERAEKHLCPMPLNITRRAVALYSNPGDVVASFFGGVGSEGVAALEMGRKAMLCELNPAYYHQAVRNLRAIDARGIQSDLWGFAEESAA